MLLRSTKALPELRCAATTRRVAKAPSTRIEAGFTLLELLVVLALIAMTSGVAVYSLSDVGDASARAEAYRLATAIRYIYDRAILDGRSYRLVIDIEAGAIRAEAVSDRKACGGGLTLDEGVKRRFKELTRKAEARAKRKAEQDGEAAPERGVVYGDYSDLILQDHALPKTVRISHIQTLAHPKKQEEGLAYIHAFPHGLIERALVVFESEGMTYSVVTEPFRGTARVYPKEIKASEVFR